MDPERWQSIRQVFHEAVGLPADQRLGFLSEATAGDDTLRVEVESLLASHDDALSFMEPDGDAIKTPELSRAPTADMTGRRIGAYKVVREIGRGGMGAAAQVRVCGAIVRGHTQAS
jgi:hypothetical protein